jgi:hypothetical protein
MGGEDDLTGPGLDGVSGAAVVESWFADHVERDLASCALGPPDDGVARPMPVGDWHEVRHLGQPRRVQGARQQHVGVRDVQLLARAAVERRTEREAATAAVVEEAGEHGRRIEVRVAEKVERTVAPDERHGAKVTDHAVVLDRRVLLLHHRRSPRRHRTRKATLKATAPPSDVNVRTRLLTVEDSKWWAQASAARGPSGSTR